MFKLLLGGYLAIAVLTFVVFLRSFYRDDSTENSDLDSWKVVGVAALFWPVVLPISYLNRKVKTARDRPESDEDRPSERG